MPKTNHKATLKGGKLHIELDLNATGEESGSGKSFVHGSTGGYVSVEGTGTGLKVSVTAIRSKKAGDAKANFRS